MPRFINNLKTPFFRFILTAFILFAAWEVLYELWLHPNRNFEILLVDQITWTSSLILKLLGFELIPSEILGQHVRTLGIDGTLGVFIADSCAGVPLLALFAGFVIAYPGPIKKKLIFIPFGLITIHFINILRIVALCLMAFYTPDKLEFNHHYTFILIVYSYIFLLWVFWVSKLSKQNLNK